MPSYLWMARTRDGEVARGELEGSGAAEVEAELRARGLTPIATRKKTVLHTQLAVPDVGVNALAAGLIGLSVARYAPPWASLGLEPVALAWVAGVVAFAGLTALGVVRRRRQGRSSEGRSTEWTGHD